LLLAYVKLLKAFGVVLVLLVHEWPRDYFLQFVLV